MNKLLSLSLMLCCAASVVIGQPFTFFQIAEENFRAEDSGKITDNQDLKKIDSLLSLPKAATDFNIAYDVSWKIGLHFLEEGKHPKALAIFDNMSSYLESLKNKDTNELNRYSMVHNVIGAIYEETGLWNEALDRYMKSLQICNQTNNMVGKAMVYNNIGKIYFNRNDLDKAEELYLKAIEINRKTENNGELFTNYMNIAGIYKLRKNYRKSLDYALIAMNRLDIDKDAYDLMLLYSNIGSLYQDMNNYTMALSYYQQAASIGVKRSYSVILIGSYLEIASVFRKKMQLDSAVYYISKSLKLAKELGNPLQKREVLKTAAEFYKFTNDFLKASEYFAQYVYLNDSLEKLNSLTRIEQIQSVYETINKEKDNEILVHKVHLQQLAIQRQRIILAGGFILFLFLAYFVFNQQRNRRREQANNEYVNRQTELFHQKEKEMMLSKEHNLQLELDFKKKELTLNVMSLMKLNEMLSGISEKILLSAKTAVHQETRDVLKKIGKEVKKSTEDETLKEFSLRFKEVNANFFDALLDRFPDLTPSELRLCAFLKLNMSSKEIGELTGQRLKAIEIARYRLRIKLGIAKSDINLVTFLTQIQP